MQQEINEAGRQASDSPVWDKVAVLAVTWPFIAGIGAGAGYLGHQLLRSDSDPLTRKQLLGGVLLATFTGTVGYFLLDALGFPEKLSVPLALLFGSSGEIGYQLLVGRAKDLLSSTKK